VFVFLGRFQLKATARGHSWTTIEEIFRVNSWP